MNDLVEIPSGRNRTREATFGERIWRRTYHGRKPRQYFFGSRGDGPPSAENRIGEQTSGRSTKTDWPRRKEARSLRCESGNPAPVEKKQNLRVLWIRNHSGSGPLRWKVNRTPAAEKEASWQQECQRSGNHSSERRKVKTTRQPPAEAGRGAVILPG